MDDIIEKSMSEPQWKGYGWEEMRFRHLVARTKLEIAKANVVGQYQQMLSSENAGSRLLGRMSEYVDYATMAFQAYKWGKRLWQQFRPNK